MYNNYTFSPLRLSTRRAFSVQHAARALHTAFFIFIPRFSLFFIRCFFCSTRGTIT